jgi:hypothetical protein
MDTFEWRAFRAEDAAALAVLFRAAISALAAPDYDAAARDAWASAADDVPAFAARLARGVTLVAWGAKAGRLRSHSFIQPTMSRCCMWRRLMRGKASRQAC